MDDELSERFKERKGICQMTGKVMFGKKVAQTKKNWLERRGREPYLRIYQCDHCDYWHLTSQRHYTKRES